MANETKDAGKEEIKTTSNAERLLEKLLAYEPDSGPPRFRTDKSKRC